MSTFFKNAIVYRLTEGSLDIDSVEEAIAKFPHSMPGNLDNMRYGFVAPFESSLVETALGITMLAAKCSYKDLPASVINEAVEAKAKQISESENRAVGRKERQTIKDEVIFNLLPKAFVKHRVTRALLIDEYIVVNTASAKQAEDFLSKLREALGSLRVVPVSTSQIPTQVMTNWVLHSPKNELITKGEDCVLQGGKDGRVIRCKGQDLTANEILNHIHTGMFVERISIDIKDKATLTINDKLVFSRIKFSDIIDERVSNENPETKLEHAIATMIVMGGELKSIIQTVFDEFGGIQPLE